MTLSTKSIIEINQSLFSITHAYESRLIKEEHQNPTGLVLSDRATLMVIGLYFPLNSRKLSSIMDINPGTISVYVQSLVSKGLIEKKQDENDRRNLLLFLTKQGEKQYKDTISGTVLYTKDFLSVLNEEESQNFHYLVNKISQSLGFNWINRRANINGN